VVLSGCETGRSDGLGLAHAFVAAGAGAAVGITRPVPDFEAEAVMLRFYDKLRRDAPPDEAAASALQAAAKAILRDRSAAPAWKSFRVFVP
jgi:CHAT domain-containing protein